MRPNTGQAAQLTSLPHDGPARWPSLLARPKAQTWPAMLSTKKPRSKHAQCMVQARPGPSPACEACMVTSPTYTVPSLFQAIFFNLAPGQSRRRSYVFLAQQEASTSSPVAPPLSPAQTPDLRSMPPRLAAHLLDCLPLCSSPLTPARVIFSRSARPSFLHYHASHEKTLQPGIPATSVLTAVISSPMHFMPHVLSY